MVLGLMTKKSVQVHHPEGWVDYFDFWAEIQFIQIRLFGLLDTPHPQPSQISVRRGLTGSMECSVQLILYGFLKPFTQGVKKR